MAEALYRKYRPQIFEDVVGQEHIERTLKNAIKSDKVSHAYLFTGPRGTGKTTTARLLAKALLCESGPTPDPDGTCEDCELIANGEHPDVYELDAASRTGVENVREEIIGRVNYAPTRGRSKVYIIDEVHMLSTAAFNALLKTLEEPPDHVVFVLCTTDPQKVPETIHSRCQRFDFRRISNEELVSRLGAICSMEGIEFEGDALDLIAHRAQGGMRDALTSLEQLIAFGEGRVTTELAERLLGSLDSSDLADIVRAIGMRDVATCFRWTSEYVETGADLAQFTQDMAEHMRNMYVMSLAGADVALDITEAARRELQVELEWFGPERLVNLLGVLGDLSSELKTSTNQRLSFEIALTRMVRPDSDLTLTALADRVEALERGYSATAHILPGANAAMDPAHSHISNGQAVAAAGMQNALSASSGASAFTDAAYGQSVQGMEPVRAAGDTAGDTSMPSAVVRAELQAIQDGGASQSANTAEVPSGVQAAGMVQSAQMAAGSQSVQAEQSSIVATATQAAPVDQIAQVAPVSPSAFPRLWDTALAHLKKTAAAYGVLLMNAKAIYDESVPSIAIEFASGSDFAFQAAQKPEVREALKEALSKAGIGFPFTMSQLASGSVSASASSSAMPSGTNAFAREGGVAETAEVPDMYAAPQRNSSDASAVAASGAAAPSFQVAPDGSGANSVSGTAVANNASEGGVSAFDADEVPLSAYEAEGYDEYGAEYSYNDPETVAEDEPPFAVPSMDGAPSEAASADEPPFEASHVDDFGAAAPTPSNGNATNPTASDLNDALAAAFGEGISFEQVE